ncbi:MAG: winged helix-turn-helix domain-containing protein, partial [Blastocatellia bacterium]|nr:winged helix-turn-helix domain-containing protein [Blastocatellia bacterium]
MESGELIEAGQIVKLQAQPSKVLVFLVRRAGKLVTRAEIQQHVWGDNFVDFDQGLNFCIRQIRLALGDQAEAPQFIETIPRQGYRFIASVVERDYSTDQPALLEQALPANPSPQISG